MIQLFKNSMSSISSNLYEGNGPITFHVLQCWIILKTNLASWMEFKSGDLFVVFFIKEEKLEKTKAEKEVNVELFVVE